jgi:MFS family permease
MNKERIITQNFKAALRALRYRNYRLFFLGQGISLIGTWMQSVAVGWFVYRLTGSPFYLGLVGFSGQIPAFLFSPFAGALSDRMNRQKILIVTQVLAMIQALLLAFGTIFNIISIWSVIALSFFLGFINAFDMPIRQAFVIEMVDDKSDLSNAIALNSGLFNASRLIGPAIAGVLINITSEGVCFLINGLSYVAAIAALANMRIGLKKTNNHNTRIITDIKDGFSYVYRFTPIRDLLIIISMIGLVGMSFPILLPVFATSILHGDSHTFGFLVSSTGIGALIGTVFLAFRKTVLGLGRIIGLTIFVFSIGLSAFSFSTNTLLSMALLVIIGFGMIVTVASCNTIMQTIVDEDKRGRVMSFYTMAFMGSAPIGSLLAGTLSSAIGAPHTIIFGGIISLIVGIVFFMRLPLMRKRIRPIYSKMGIIPEVALGLQAANELRKPPVYSGT